MKARFLWAAVLVVGCAGGVDKKIEETQYLLDDGNFSAAIVKAREIVASDPTNVQGQFLLASALMGDSMLGARAACPNDTGYLGLLACLLDDPSPNKDFASFARIAPDTLAKVGELEEARDILIALTGTVPAANARDIYAQLFVARLDEIAAVTKRIGLCTAGFDANALTADQVTRFQDNLENAGPDATKAGFSDGLGLTERLTKISDAITTAGGVSIFFTAQNALGC